MFRYKGTPAISKGLRSITWKGTLVPTTRSGFRLMIFSRLGAWIMPTSGMSLMLSLMSSGYELLVGLPTALPPMEGSAGMCTLAPVLSVTVTAALAASLCWPLASRK